MTFEGPPYLAPETGRIVQEYDEYEMSFTPIDPSAPWAGFVRWGGGGGTGRPDDGSAYLQAGITSTLAFGFTNSWLLSLQGVDLAEYSTGFQVLLTVHIVGYRYDGSVVTTDLTTDGIIDGSGPLEDFQTFHFGPEWYGLTRVEIPTHGWSLDNLVVARWVPEPSSGALLLAGALCLGVLRRGIRKRSSQ